MRRDDRPNPLYCNVDDHCLVPGLFIEPMWLAHSDEVTVKHFTTFDLYGRFDVTKRLSLHGSVTNLFNTKAPADWVTYSGGVYPFNPSLHTAGAIGAYFSLGATYTLL